jgi:hypothetical protein
VTRQWFHFTLPTRKGQLQQLTMTNAVQSRFAKGGRGYQTLASYDQLKWFRVQSTLMEKT